MNMKLSNEVKVSLVTAVCILALAIILKNILHVQIDFISQYGPVWMLITYLITREGCEKSKICGSALLAITIVLVTLTIFVILHKQSR